MNALTVFLVQVEEGGPNAEEEREEAAAMASRNLYR
jgi:hypothetical protein